MSHYTDGLGYLTKASSQLGVSPETDVWQNLVAAQVCFNAAIQLDKDAALYYARAEVLEWMGLLANDKEFFQLALVDLDQVIDRERRGERPSLLLNAFWLRSRLWPAFSLEKAIDDLTCALTLCPTELSFYLKRAEYQLKRGCPKACTEDLMLALSRLLEREDPNREAYNKLYTAMSLELAIADHPLDRIAHACATLLEFWSNHQQYWFYSNRPGS